MAVNVASRLRCVFNSSRKNLNWHTLYLLCAAWQKDTRVGAPSLYVAGGELKPTLALCDRMRFLPAHTEKTGAFASIMVTPQVCAHLRGLLEPEDCQYSGSKRVIDSMQTRSVCCILSGQDHNKQYCIHLNLRWAHLKCELLLSLSGPKVQTSSCSSHHMLCKLSMHLTRLTLHVC